MRLANADIRYVAGSVCTRQAPRVGAQAFQHEMIAFIDIRVQTAAVGAPRVAGTTVDAPDFDTYLAEYQLLNQPGFANATNEPLHANAVTLSRSDLITFGTAAKLAVGSGSEDDAGARRRLHNSARHHVLDHECGVKPGAVHGHEVVRLNLLERVRCLRDECIRCGRQVKAAYYRVDLVYPRDRLDVLDRVDDAGMSTR
jgi:hypothetical protein